VRGSGGLSSSGGEVLCRECGATKTNNSQRERERESAPERRQHKQTGRTGNYYIPAAAAVDIAIEECDVGIVVVVCLCCVRFFDKDNETRIDHGFWGGGRGKKIANVNHEEGRMMNRGGRAAADGRTDGWW
jgi:hypothetical protein